MSAVVCGLDIHKKSTYATVLDRDGQVFIQRKIPNEDIPSFLEPIKPEKLAMEASTYIIPLYRKLTEQGYNVTVSHPKKTRYIAEARIKSDRVDSRALAELLRLDSLPESYVPPREIAETRERVRRRAFLVRQVTKLKVKIRDVLAYEGIKPPTGYGLFTAKGVEWLHGGSALPSHIELGFQVRTVPGQTAETIKADLKRLVKKLQMEDPHFEAEIDWPRWPTRPAVNTPYDSPLVKTFASAHKDLIDDPPLDVSAKGRLGSAADGSHTFGVGIPTILLGPSGGPRDVYLEEKYPRTDKDERILIDDIVNCAKVFAISATRLCG